MELTQQSMRVRYGDQLHVIRAGLAAAMLASGALAYQIGILDQERRILFVSQKWTAAFAVGIFGVLLSLAALAASWTPLGGRLAQWFERLLRALGNLGRFNLVLFIFCIATFVYLILGPQGYLFAGLIARLCLLGMVVFLGGMFLKSSGFLSEWTSSLVLSWLLTGAAYKIATLPDLQMFFLPEVVKYPFSLGWSEASRYYYASLFFGERIYGLPTQPSVLHPSRYLMQALPFLISGLPLWVHRLWQVLLWLVFTGAAAHALAKRLRIEKAWIRLAFTTWAFLFLFQGPVYYHLLVPALIVFWGFDSSRFWRTLAIVLVASAWAGISRINWFPVPGLLAGTLYFLEISPVAPGDYPGEKKSAWRTSLAYLSKPVLWAASGTLVAFAAQALYVLWSGADPRLFTSSFTSDLLWYRLWPNPTYPLGILPSILLVSAPLLLLLAMGWRGLHPLRILGIASALVVLFAGGVVVSTKIGGGSNLHNLDAFLTLLLVVGSYAFFRELGGWGTSLGKRLVVTLALFMPVMFGLAAGGPVSMPEREQVEGALHNLEVLTEEATSQGGEVLFISQRHLLTFGILKNIPLVENYENVFLMEMAMSGNEYYLDSFYQDLRRRRFALIISDQQGNRLKGSEFPFGEENDVWVTRVTQPLLENYRRKDLLKRFGIEVLEPRR
jgi:hypothetical protein